MDKKIFLLSNGHGEDIIGAKLAEAILEQIKDVDLKVLPIVGLGNAYKSLDVKLLDPRRVLPTGGFARTGITNLWKDLKGGLAGLTVEQIKTIKENKNVDLTIVVGDIFLLFLAGTFGAGEVIFLPTAKSEYISGHYWIEEFLMKRIADVAFPRDQRTTDALQQAGVNAKFVGNLMMDCFQVKGADFQGEDFDQIIGILPGSRVEAYSNFRKILKVIERIEKKDNQDYLYLTALAGSLELDRLIEVIKELSWQVKRTEELQEENGVALKLYSPTGKSEVQIVKHHFGDILVKSDLFIGLAGTANEQAVGMGKPVITFPGEGAQFTPGFARAQKSLLGDSIAFINNYDPEQIADKLIEILSNEDLYNTMSQAGKKRMGPPGAAQKLAQFIKDYLD